MRNAWRLLLVAVVAVVALPGVFSWAQETRPATSAAASQPARPRYVLTVPPGFEQIEVSGRKLLCEPGDKSWIEEAVKGLKPATRPTTMPADLIGRLEALKDGLARRMASDYGLADASGIARHLDQLAGELKRLRDFSPPLFYLVTTHAHLKALVKSDQWTNPGFHYNRLADDVMFRESVPLSLERQMDDTVLTCLYLEADTAAQKQEKLQNVLRATQVQLDRMLTGQAGYVTQMMLVQSIQDEVFAAMKLPIEQGWLGTGLAGVTSADYASELIGSSRHELLFMIAAELRTNPVKMGTIDLLHPTDPTSLKRQYVAAYVDAYRRKSMSVAMLLVEKSRDKIPDLVKSMREKPCATGEELVTRIREVTGFDVTRYVAAE